MPPKDLSRDELLGVTIAGRYRIISRLGAGGMGVAYRAWDEQNGVLVVIKIPKKFFLKTPPSRSVFTEKSSYCRGYFTRTSSRLSASASTRDGPTSR